MFAKRVGKARKAGFLASDYPTSVLVQNQQQDEGTDGYLHAAVILSLGLATRQRRPADEGNIKALADVEDRIQKEVARHDKMRKMAESIQRNAEDLGAELRKGSDKMNLLLRNAKDTLRALNVELADAEQPDEAIALGEGTLGLARGSLSAA